MTNIYPQHSPKNLVSKQTSYYRVNSANKFVQDSDHSENEMLGLCERKRSKKHKLLVQLAVVGVFVWGLLLLVNYCLDKQMVDNESSLSASPTNTNLSLLYDLHSLQRARSKSVQVAKVNSTLKTQQLTRQLQDIRMHNVMRAFQWSKTNNIIGFQANSQVNSHTLAVHTLDPKSYRKNLVEKWERDFDLINN